jgi:hypothetical protein
MNSQNFQKKNFFFKVMSLKKSIVPSGSHLRMIFFLYDSSDPLSPEKY